ncbi:MAG: agmatinase [Candidatus Kapabacteria bacterium]|nr:agmatinase [Ignavibacteriota bacterium]MCW5884203.1 agmatinase [Candidatus Kapabacteria bacterium]
MITLNEENNFLAIEEKYSNYENSKIVIISAPYEHTVSYGKGAGEGPRAILEASAYVEFYDDETDRELCFDKGIATLQPLDFTDIVDKDALDLIENAVSKSILDGKFVVTLGGEHSISTAPIAAHYKHYPNMTILHFDAHSDLRDTYLDSKYSHASFMARVVEFYPPEKITQVGIRAQCKEESIYIKEKGVKTFYASAIRRGLHGQDWQKAVVDSLGDVIYCTFDLDFFDPAIMAATGTPEPEGFLYSETIDIFRKIKAAGKKIIGFDVVELAPSEYHTHCDLTSARLIYKILNLCID